MPLKWAARNKKPPSAPQSCASKPSSASQSSCVDERISATPRSSISSNSSPNSKNNMSRHSHSNGSVYSDETTLKTAQTHYTQQGQQAKPQQHTQQQQQQPQTPMQLQVPTGQAHKRTLTCEDMKAGARCEEQVSPCSQPAGSPVRRGGGLNGETYDGTVFRLGWVNKAQGAAPAREGRYSHQPTASLSSIGSERPHFTGGGTSGYQYVATAYRLHRAQLKGCILNLYKSGLTNVKYFDPALEPSAAALQMHQERQEMPLLQPPLPSEAVPAPSILEASMESGELRLEYLSEAYPHPDLQLDKKDGKILSGSLESLCHAVLFMPTTDAKRVTDILLLLPLLDDFTRVLNYFNLFGKVFSKHHPAGAAGADDLNQNYNISNETDRQLTLRLATVVQTVLDMFPGFLLDDKIFQSLVILLDTISFHDEDTSQELKVAIAEKQTVLVKLTGFANEPIQSAKLDVLIKVQSFLKLDTEKVANQIHKINLTFNRVWSPQADYSLLYDSQYTQKHVELNPLVFFNDKNVQYLSRLMVSHIFCEETGFTPKKRAEVLTKWVQLGCKFERLGDMVSWLAIATVICSIPVLRLTRTWQYVPDSYLKIIFKDWVPTIVQLDRRQMSSKSMNSVFILAPPNLNDAFVRDNVIPYFGDLVIHSDDLPRDSKYKYLEKKIRRTKNAFYKWQQRLDQAFAQDRDSASSFTDSLHLDEEEHDVADFYQYWRFHMNLPPMNIETIMEMSLKMEPPSINQQTYSKTYSTRSALISGAYLPTLFTTLLPSYSLFPQELLIAAASTPSTKNNNSSQASNRISQLSVNSTPHSNASSSSAASAVTGIDNIDVPITKEISSKLSNKQVLLKFIRDMFNVDINVFHISDDVIFKSIRDYEAKSRPTSVVIESPKRLSLLSSVSPDVSAVSSALENLDLFKNFNSSSDDIAEFTVQVVLKCASLEKIFDILVLTSRVFSNLVTTTDLVSYFNSEKARREKSGAQHNGQHSIGLLDFALISLIMDNELFAETFFNNYKSFTTTLCVLENLAKRFIGAKSSAISISLINKLRNSESSRQIPPSTTSNQFSASGIFKPSYDELKFPVWDLKVTSVEGCPLDYLAKIQIGVLESLYHLIREHYADFTDDLANNKTFLDILKIINQEVYDEWDKRLDDLRNNNNSSQKRKNSCDDNSSAKITFHVNDARPENSNENKRGAATNLGDSSLAALEKLQCTLQDLYVKIKSSYQRQLYRPLGVTRNCRKVHDMLCQFQPQTSMSALIMNGSSDTLDKMVTEFQALKHTDYDDIINWIYKLDHFITSKLKLVSNQDWIQVSQILESLSNDSLVALFNYPLHAESNNVIASGSSQLDDLQILDIFTWLSTLESGSAHIIDKFPASVQLIVRLHLSLTKFFTVHIAHLHSTYEARVNTCSLILEILNFVHVKNANVNLFHSDDAGEGSMATISPHVPSFIETAIENAIISPESRFFEVSWKQAYKTISEKDEKLTFIGSVLTGLDKSTAHFLDADNRQPVRPKNFSPCPGWFISRLLEITGLVPNMSIENSKMINFDKRRFINNIVINYQDLIPNTEQLPSHDDEKSAHQFGSILFHYGTESSIKAFRKASKEAASNEARKLKFQAMGLFNDILVTEVYKVQRDQKKQEQLTVQEHEAKRSVLIQHPNKVSVSSASSSVSGSSSGSTARTSNPAHAAYALNMAGSLSISAARHGRSSVSSRSSVISNTATATSPASGASPNQTSTSHHGGMGKKIGGFLRRPFSISGFTSSSSQYTTTSVVLSGVQANGSISPYELPELTSEIQDTKIVTVIKTFEIKSCIQINNYRQDPDMMHCFKIVMEDGTQHTLQCMDDADMHEWMKAITLSKRYSFHSKRFKGKTSNKIFGVPVEDVCEREGALIPNIIVKLLDEIELRGLDEVGLYRVPGSVGSINALKNAFDDEGAVHNTFTLEDDRWFEINTIAGCFKLYLRELPESLFTNEKVDEFVNIMTAYKNHEVDLSQFQNGIKTLLSTLPVFNYHILKRLFLHLNRVHQHVENNRMDASNLAIVFSMSFINQDDLASTMGPTLGLLQMLLQHLIRNPEHYFT
ncbi:AGR144Cp [Eremothecium gossypii ATCC 10895]|uniref:GTPase-activating protein BEM2 n=1 Tax=Eremothecium gossypii (strain ATCC 10895 / CBS 109.51 / FGSC 9923 / NRRL Y-1056) TaxID=284811 RepID=BEM2_EREGS|nr:AGR144Cp [Eremothecium gossypii ATCC 10895]Q9HF75.1 RecName: Full=GTPase-activating protein BEM2 [Eremothecium gossypii ATCC 10895]AAG43463.1 GTPase activating protein BEM2 [Eremothecium gossypii]AAS54634.1 AGR144Cp [Eremothecium gossypii ATCC 10895]AEY98964.1 FAGR144Cp [Eremothecium gossypii FDAG1]